MSHTNPFLESYTVMGNELTCISVQVSSTFKLESDLDNWLKDKVRKQRWKFIKVDTVNQIGFPDILLLKGAQYCLIESKRLKRKKLTNVIDNLTFEPGQIPFMLKALLNKQRYILAVCKDNYIGFIGDSDAVNTLSLKELLGIGEMQCTETS